MAARFLKITEDTAEPSQPARDEKAALPQEVRLDAALAPIIDQIRQDAATRQRTYLKDAEVAAGGE